MGSITATAARKDLYNLISSVNENCAPVIITNSRGKGAVLVGEDEWSAIEETLYLNSIPGMAESILTGGEEHSLGVRRRRRPGVVGCGMSNSPGRPSGMLRN